MYISNKHPRCLWLSKYAPGYFVQSKTLTDRYRNVNPFGSIVNRVAYCCSSDLLLSGSLIVLLLLLSGFWFCWLMIVRKDIQPVSSTS